MPAKSNEVQCFPHRLPLSRSEQREQSRRSELENRDTAYLARRVYWTPPRVNTIIEHSKVVVN